MKKLKTHRERLPRTRIERVLRLAGLDDGAHLGECGQFERDAMVYPAMEAAALAHSYLDEGTASMLGDFILEAMDWAEGPTYCHVCGTRDRERFNTEKSVQACEECYDENGPPNECARCHKATYEGDWYGAYVWKKEAVEEGFCSMDEVGQAIKDREILSSDRLYSERLVRWENREYVCDLCAEKGLAP
jgi:hypothetical protein